MIFLEVIKKLIRLNSMTDIRSLEGKDKIFLVKLGRPRMNFLFRYTGRTAGFTRGFLSILSAAVAAE